jgi:hypothetical protein
MPDTGCNPEVAGTNCPYLTFRDEVFDLVANKEVGNTMQRIKYSRSDGLSTFFRNVFKPYAAIVL